MRRTEIPLPSGQTEAGVARLEGSARQPAGLPWLVAGLILVAGMVRVYYAAACHLNPDEAMHWSAAADRSWSGAYAASRNQAHPPLLILATHAWLGLGLGSSELMLRTPSLLLGLLSLGLAYRWMYVAAGPLAAVAGLSFLVVSPAMIATATELRQAAWLLAFAFAALLAAETVVRRHTLLGVLGLSLALSGALLSHYSAVWIVIALGLYVPLCLWRTTATARPWIAWGLGQLLVAGVGFWSYFIHAARWAPTVFGPSPAGAPPSGAARFSYVAPLLPTPERNDLIGFVVPQVVQLWEYLCGHWLPATVALAAITLAAARAIYDGRWRRGHGQFPLLLVLAFVVAAGAGLSSLYPFGGSRHSAYLLPFAAAAVGMASATLLNQRPRLGLVLLILILPPWLAGTRPANDPERLGQERMQAALDFVDAQPRDEVLFVDFQTHNLLQYYWRARQPRTVGRLGGAMHDWRFGSRRVVATTWGVWGFNDNNLGPLTTRLAYAVGAAAVPQWMVMSTAWPKHQPIERRPPGWESELHSFGPIWVLQLRRPAAAP